MAAQFKATALVGGIYRGLAAQSKGGKSRNVYISPITIRAIRRYLSNRKDSDPALFISQRLQPLNRDSLRLIMYRLCDKAGIERKSSHAIRHTAASCMARSGIDSWSLMKLLGHADNRVSLRYIWLTQSQIQEAHTKYGPVNHAIKSFS
jgi:integrase